MMTLMKMKPSTCGATQHSLSSEKRKLEEEGFGDQSERRGNTVQEPNRKDTKERGGNGEIR
jgi:hypothetical protein